MRVPSESIRLTKYIGIWFIIFSVGITYYPLINIFFASPDDNWMLLKNKKVMFDNFSIDYLKSIFSSKDEIQYSPVNTLYYAILYRVNGFDPYIYHMGSLLLHLFNTFVLYILTIDILNIFRVKRERIIAFVVCYIWAIHPLNVEAVAWISASKVLLFTFFSMLSMSLFFKYIKTNKPIFIFFSLLTYLLACLCKEQAITLPLVLATFMVCNHLQPFASKWPLKKYIVIALGFGTITLLFFILNYYINTEAAYPMPATKYSFFERLVISFYCLRFYFTNTIVPLNLHFHYNYPFPPSGVMNVLFLIYPVLFLLFLYILLKMISKSRHRYLYIFCVSSFFINLLPVLQIFPLTRNTVMADRYMYFAIIFLLIALIEFFINNIVIKKAIITVIIITVFFYFIGYSNKLVQNWEKLNLARYETTI